MRSNVGVRIDEHGEEYETKQVECRRRRREGKDERARSGRWKWMKWRLDAYCISSTASGKCFDFLAYIFPISANPVSPFFRSFIFHPFASAFPLSSSLFITDRFLSPAITFVRILHRRSL